MLSLKRSLIIAWSLLCLLAFAACSGIPTTGNATTYTDPATSANTQTTNTQKSTTQPTSTQTQIQVTQQKPVATTMATPTPAPANNQNTGSTTNGGQNAPAMPTNNNQNTNQTYPTPTPSQSTTTGGNSQNTGNQNMTGPTFIRVTPMFINGQTLQILTTGTGLTLYYRTSDVAPNTVCTGICAQSWPALLAHGQIITSASITSGSLTILKTANGKQLAYNGHPLYTYVGDTMPGQINGQGLGNVWQIVSVKTLVGHW